MPKQKEIPKSNCCNAPVTVGGDKREGTRYYVCSQCGEACDAKERNDE